MTYCKQVKPGLICNEFCGRWGILYPVPIAQYSNVHVYTPTMLSQLIVRIQIVFFNNYCTTIYRYIIFGTRYSVMCKVYTGYHGTSEIEHNLCACTVDNPLAKARGLSLRTGAHTMLFLSLVMS